MGKNKNQTGICEICKEAKRLLKIRWGETTEECPRCGIKTKVFYRREGAFVVNHCQNCHENYNEDYPTLASAVHAVKKENGLR